MLSADSGEEARLAWVGGTDLDSDDIQFALQLLWVGLGVDFTKADPSARLSCLTRDLGRRNRLKHRLRIRATRRLLADRAGLGDGGDVLELLSLEDIVRRVHLWREELTPQNKLWRDADREELLRIAGIGEDFVGDVSPRDSDRFLPNVHGGVNLSWTVMCWGSWLVSRLQPMSVSALKLLFLSAREWMDADQFHRRFYGESEIDPQILEVILDAVCDALGDIVPRAMLRPQDWIDDDDEFYVSGVAAGRLKEIGVIVRDDTVQPGEADRDDPLMQYNSIHAIVTCTARSIIADRRDSMRFDP